MSTTAEKLELVADGKSYFVDVKEAERELGIASGDTKEITTAALKDDGDSGAELPLMAIRPHQTLVIKAVDGKLSCPGCVGGGRLLHGEAVKDGAEAHFKAHHWCPGAQGNGNAWIHLTDADGKSRKLCFGYLVTKT